MTSLFDMIMNFRFISPSVLIQEDIEPRGHRGADHGEHRGRAIKIAAKVSYVWYIVLALIKGTELRF